MALRRTLAKRLFCKIREPSPLVTLQHSPISHPSIDRSPNAAKSNFHREFRTSPDYAGNFSFRRLLQRRWINQAARFPEFLTIPVGDKFKDRLRSLNIAGDHLRLDGLSPFPMNPTAEKSVDGLTVPEARKIMRIAQLEKLRSRLRQIEKSSISYSEFVQICVDDCLNREQGLEFAKSLDDSGNVIVLGNVVYLRPEQVAKSMEKIIMESMAIPNDPRRKELEKMEMEKTIIDTKAESEVRTELYCGLGFIVIQTLGFMRLTFWELSWDVMEPICFFVTSLHFALAYAFFLRTSKEPSFEGYFQRRFKAKQKKLMKTHNFDLQKYNQLCTAFYPNFANTTTTTTGHFTASEHAGGAIFGAVYR